MIKCEFCDFKIENNSQENAILAKIAEKNETIIKNVFTLQELEDGKKKENDYTKVICKPCYDKMEQKPELFIDFGPRYCNYCTCTCCTFGTKKSTYDYLTNAKTKDGKQVCDVCYQFDICVDENRKVNKFGTCDKPCNHRPELVSEFV